MIRPLAFSVYEWKMDPEAVMERVRVEIAAAVENRSTGIFGVELELLDHDETVAKVPEPACEGCGQPLHFPTKECPCWVPFMGINLASL